MSFSVFVVGACGLFGLGARAEGLFGDWRRRCCSIGASVSILERMFERLASAGRKAVKR